MGGPGNDDLVGGADEDEVSYRDSTEPVTIDLTEDGPQNGGSEGDDTLSEIEDVRGSDAGDVLRGNGSDNDLNGFQGDDLIEGRDGDDLLDGGSGIDTLSYENAPSGVTVDLADDEPQDTGGAGEDFLLDVDFEFLRGSPHDDTLRGTNGINRIDGLGGLDTIFARGGDDEIQARDNVPDTVDCGPGDDEAFLDPESVDGATNCESAVFLPEPDDEVVVLLGGGRIPLTAGGLTRAIVACPSAEQSPPCRGFVALLTRGRIQVGDARRRIVLAIGRFRMDAGEVAGIRMRVPRARAQIVRRKPRARSVFAFSRFADSAGNRGRARRGLRMVPLGPRRGA